MRKMLVFGLCLLLAGCGSGSGSDGSTTEEPEYSADALTEKVRSEFADCVASLNKDGYTLTSEEDGLVVSVGDKGRIWYDGNYLDSDGFYISSIGYEYVDYDIGLFDDMEFPEINAGYSIAEQSDDGYVLYMEDDGLMYMAYLDNDGAVYRIDYNGDVFDVERGCRCTEVNEPVRGSMDGYHAVLSKITDRIRPLVSI